MIYYTFQAKFILFTILFFGTAAGMFAADGDLDPSFDGDGILITDNDSGSDSITDLAVQPDGKIIALGNSFDPSFSSQRAVIVRYLPSGSVDSTFGTNGKVIIPSVFLEELALQTNGKIVFAGSVGTFPNTDLYVARLNSDGSFDTTFNGTGALTLDLRGTSDSATSVKIQPDEKIVVGVSAFQPGLNFQRGDFAIVRFNADGSLDATFDGDGKVFTPLQESAEVRNLAIQPDGKIVAVGESFLTEVSSGNPIGSFATVRYNPNGSIDTTFNGNGVAFTQFVSRGSPGNTRNNRPETVLIRTDGKILVVGTTRSCCGPQPLSQVAMIQYNPNGSVDSSFGNAGKIQIGFSTFAATGAYDAAIQADNKIVIAGVAQGNIKAPLVAVVARFNVDGSLDSTFSGDGWNTLQLPNGISSNANAIAIQPDGKILIGGDRSQSGQSRDFLLARFEASSCLMSCLGARQKVADFDGDGKTDLSVFRNGTWFINPSGANNPNNFYGVQFGLPTDKLTPADFDGDGKTDVAIWRENVIGSLAYFYILQSSTNTLRIAQFGQTGDDPRVVGDWSGDGKADLAVYRNGTSAGVPSFFFYRPSFQPSVDFVTVYWGTAGDEAVRGDFDGDGRMDAAVFRPSDGIWYILQSSQALQFQPRYERWGLASDKRVSGDFDGDGKTDLAVYRDGLWVVLQSSNNQPRYEHWGLSGDRLVAGDYDGDGRTDFAVWRAGVYYILHNSNSQAAYQNFGVSDDIPIASVFVR